MQPAARHLEREKTLAWILAWFFWPGIYREVVDFCASCPECQLTAPWPAEKAPLIPLLPMGLSALSGLELT